jgi:hypothetical protein
MYAAALSTQQLSIVFAPLHTGTMYSTQECTCMHTYFRHTLLHLCATAAAAATVTATAARTAATAATGCSCAATLVLVPLMLLTLLLLQPLLLCMSCRTLAEQMGGTVGFVDNAPHGTVMTLRVPTRLEPQAAQQQSQRQQLQVDPDEAAARRVTTAAVAAATATAAAAAIATAAAAATATASASVVAAAAAAVADCTDALGEVLKVKRVLVSDSAALLVLSIAPVLTQY